MVFSFFSQAAQLGSKLAGDSESKDSKQRGKKAPRPASAPVLADGSGSEALSGLAFRHPLRRYQKEIIELVKIKMERGERQLHIVAPPGAGKTIIGLQLIAEFKQPSLVVCPTTTIQAQWGQKLDLFLPPEMEGFPIENLIGTHEDKPLKPITLLTYQVLSTPGHEIEYLQKLAHQQWVDELSRGSSVSKGEAELRVMELLSNNKKAFDREMSRHVSRLRRKLTEVIDLKEVLHKNAVELLQSLRRQGVKVVIFDECHHLTDYWAAVMTHVVNMLDDAIVIGLTGTPPEGKSAGQETRYISLVGEIDYQVPTPALVREGGLAPFQDLVYFTEPTKKESQFLAAQHEEFHAIIQELVVSEPPLLRQWVQEKLVDAINTKAELSGDKSKLMAAMLRFAFKYKLDLPVKLEASESLRQSPLLDDWMIILEDFALNFLKVSASTENHKLYDHIRSAIAKLGYGLTERGLRKQASPVDRILAFSRSKPEAVAEILSTEYRNLEDRLRTAVVTDFEKMSATSVKTAKGVLSAESGGAVAVLRELLQHPVGAMINPCLVTGSLMLVDRRIADQFIAAAAKYLEDEGYKLDLRIEECVMKRNEPAPEPEPEISQDKDTSTVSYEADEDAEERMVAESVIAFDPDEPERPAIELEIDPPPPDQSIQLKADAVPEEPFVEITAGGADWAARLYVGMATALLERGITKCLVGTRGIFGEGWDCQALNTLIDLTTTTTPMSVKQLRGRSIRLNVNDPLGARKVANNWDVVCIAPSLEKGLNDYQRFVRKHDGYYGISDDGQIECGVGHVHPSFSELTPAEVFQHYGDFNREMSDRALCRDQIYELWKVGQPYQNRSLGCVELNALRKLALTPPNLRKDLTYKQHAQLMRASLDGLWFEYGALGSAASGLFAFALLSWGMPLYLCLLPLILAGSLGRMKYNSLYFRLKSETCRPNTQESTLVDMSVALLSALQQVKLLPRHISKQSIKVTQRSDGSYRAFLDDVEAEHSQYFAKSLRELLSPVTNQPYLIPKHEFYFPRTKVKDVETIETLIAEMAPVEEVTTSVGDPKEATHENYDSEEAFFTAYLQGKAQPRVAAYHPVPSLLARSEKGREAFQNAWNKYVSPGFIIETELKPELLNKYFGIGPSLAQRMLWE